MITKEKYIILDKLPEHIYISAELCIINFNISLYRNEVNDLINANPDVVFWAASDDFSKKYIKLVSDLGISNVLPLPINTDNVETFLSSCKNNNEKLFNCNYEKLNNSKILIIDDNESNVKLLNETLFDLGIEIKTCLNPLSALELIKQEKFSLFLLDILMPALSGFELAEIIKKSPINFNTPIVFISAISGTENILNGYNLGAYSYIEKPFNINIVKSQIYNILKNEEIKVNQDKEKEHFVATLTHDLKSPINAEICALNYLLDKSEDNPIRDYNELLTDVLSSAKYMKLITDKILAHYKQKNTSLILHRELVPFSKLIVESIEELKYLSNEKNIKLIFETNLQEDDIYVDVIEIKRVINNLLANAIEYSRKNGVINILLTKELNYYICSIRDYGVGIEINDVERVFEDYISFSKTQRKTGFGLGLNICKKIVNAHGGDITIKSKHDKGTTVRFSIPLK